MFEHILEYLGRIYNYLGNGIVAILPSSTLSGGFVVGRESSLTRNPRVLALTRVAHDKYVGYAEEVFRLNA